MNSADGAVVPVRETALWREDWVGLRALDAAGRVDFLTAPGPHMHITRAWFREEVVDRVGHVRVTEENLDVFIGD